MEIVPGKQEHHAPCEDLQIAGEVAQTPLQVSDDLIIAKGDLVDDKDCQLRCFGAALEEPLFAQNLCLSGVKLAARLDGLRLKVQVDQGHQDRSAEERGRHPRVGRHDHRP